MSHATRGLCSAGNECGPSELRTRPGNERICYLSHLCCEISNERSPLFVDSILFHGDLFFFFFRQKLDFRLPGTFFFRGGGGGEDRIIQTFFFLLLLTVL